ncbi:hypothetical protein MMC24_001444 [Lignoscripta atroalba]|nr:hypothetical protein [Lignoscripta atroalba]
MLSTKPWAYESRVEAEPMARYRYGGYHPVHLGDLLKNGRYKIIHKLGYGGYGGYSTVWLARDLEFQRYVTLKIAVSETTGKSKELRVFRRLSAGKLNNHPGSRHVLRLLDDFEHTGPNGTHICLAFDVLGPSVKARAERFGDGRLPGSIAREISRQALLGLDCLHQQGVTHGDLHPGNILFAGPNQDARSKDELYQILGDPDIGEVVRVDRKPLGHEVPRYLVSPASFPTEALSSNPYVKLTDLGEAFVDHDRPETLHCPLVYRAPEVIFNDVWDCQVDIWSMGCTIFELVVGYPPFDNLQPNKDRLIQQMAESIGTLPEKWKVAWKKSYDHAGGCSEHGDPVSLERWLEETYFDEDKKQDLSPANIQTLGALLRQMLRFNPGARPPVTELVRHPWFSE